MASVLITYLNIENRLDRQYDYDDGQSELNYILVADITCLSDGQSELNYNLVADITCLSALSSVSTFVLLLRVVLLRLIVFCFLFIFSLSFSLAFDRPIICLFSLLQKTDSLSIIYNAGF